jgi:hypothetical protein
MCLLKSLICFIGKENICQIYQKKNRRLFLIWKHCDVMNKTFSRLFLKNAWKPLIFTQIIAPEKVCPSVEQNKIYIYCVLIKDGKYT